MHPHYVFYPCQTESRTNLYVNEVVQSREGKVHAFYHAPQQEHADLYNTEMDAAGQGRSVIPPTISPPPTIPERQAVPTEEEVCRRFLLPHFAAISCHLHFVGGEND